MSTTLVRYADAGESRWGLLDGTDVIALPETISTTAGALSVPGETANRALASKRTTRLPVGDLRLLHPTPQARIFCQGANYRSHMVESGLDPDRTFNMLFTKSTASLNGPDDPIVRPAHVQLLDYEVELGIVLGKAITGPTEVTDATLPDYIGAFVVANDVTARDIQLPQGQWFKGKSYRTFCPVGPYLVIPNRDEAARWRDLRLTLSVNEAERQNSLAGDMAFGPAQTLSEFSQLEDLAVGDLLLTGTPGGVALQPPPGLIQRIVGLLPDERRWDLFIKTQRRSPAYLKPGDQVSVSIRTDDGTLDLGTQHSRVS